PDDASQATLMTPVRHHQTLREAVEHSMARYFAHLDGEQVTDLHAMVMAEVE
ncbi:MAG TPA: Fis family transcriptional regulator, partial [Cobetia sp.]|nr:Fis family transcriptional regulator [Cobetia sp.]